MEQAISYLNRNYDDYRDALIEYSKKYFPDFALEYDDASVAAWLLGLNAAVADNLSYHIDRVYQETNIESAQERKSLFNIARNNGVKIPGPKGSMAEVRISCVLPADLTTNTPNWGYAPIIKRGTRVTSSGQQFEILENVDFAEQFNNDGVSDRTYVPNTDSNGIITGYTVSKLSVVVAGETRVYRQLLKKSDIKPFMEVVIPVQNIMNIESVLVVDGSNQNAVPTYGAFYADVETCPKSGTTRFFEVDFLAQGERWGDELDVDNMPKRYKYGYTASGETINGSIATYMVTKGEWKPVRHKFITEYTDEGYLKLIFGAGNETSYSEIGEDMSDFSKWQISRMLNNESLGILPHGDSTMFILYRVGGGLTSNVARGAISRISYLNAEFRGSNTSILNTVKKTLSVTNTTPSVSGKDMPSNEELKYLIKYHNAAQERCVTVKDYIDRILNMPPKYGTPFRVGVVEENNKVMLYLLGINYLGQLDTLLPITIIKNIEKYLSRYKMLNDYVEIKSGKIINLEFQVDIIVDRNYNKADVVSKVIDTVKSYMDINKHVMGEDIYIGDLEKEIGKVDGVLNLIELAVYNKMEPGYSQTQISQPVYEEDYRSSELSGSNTIRIDLFSTDGILYSDNDTMFEIKVPATDIKIRIKER